MAVNSDWTRVEEDCRKALELDSSSVKVTLFRNCSFLHNAICVICDYPFLFALREIYLLVMQTIYVLDEDKLNAFSSSFNVV